MFYNVVLIVSNVLYVFQNQNKQQRRTNKNKQSRSLLSIEDPLNIKNDIAGGSYKIVDIQKAFERTSTTLNDAANALGRDEGMNQHVQW